MPVLLVIFYFLEFTNTYKKYESLQKILILTGLTDKDILCTAHFMYCNVFSYMEMTWNCYSPRIFLAHDPACHRFQLQAKKWPPP
jgi:hypothetical protein